jgi:hypothetical protein
MPAVTTTLLVTAVCFAGPHVDEVGAEVHGFVG